MFYTLLIILASLVIMPAAIRNCCDDGESIQSMSFDFCSDGKKVSIVCADGSTTRLSNSWQEFKQYVIGEDERGEYLDAWGSGYVSRAPHFCEGIFKYRYINDTLTLAVVCDQPVTYYSEMTDDTRLHYSHKGDSIYNYYELTLNGANFLSFLLMATTAMLYHYLPDTEEKCTFHLCICMTMGHGGLFYIMMTKGDLLLPELCITKLYLQTFFLLSTFCWIGVISFDMWSRSGEKPRQNKAVLMSRYSLFGYGFPSLMIVLSNMAAHFGKLYTEFSFELSCYVHGRKQAFSVLLLCTISSSCSLFLLYCVLSLETTMIIFFTISPIVVILIASLFFFIDIQRKLGSSQEQSSNLQRDKFSLQKVKYRVSLYRKLPIIIGVPWMSIFFCLIFSSFDAQGMSKWFWYAGCFFATVISCEGVFVFYILVVSRSRVQKTFADRWILKKLFTWTVNWQTNVDNDSELASGEVQNREIVTPGMPNV